VLGGEASDDGAGLRFLRKRAQGGRYCADEGLVSVLEREAQLRRGAQLGVGAARVVERPFDELAHEITLEAGERRALGACQHHHHGGTVRQTIVEQVSGQRVVLGIGLELPHVFRGAQGAHASAGAAAQLADQLRWYGCGKELLFTGEVLVQVADGRAGSRRHRAHRGRVVAQLGEGASGRRHERLAHLRLSYLDHLKENYIFSFSDRKRGPPKNTRGYFLPTKAKASRPSVTASGFLAVMLIHSFISRPWPGSK